LITEIVSKTAVSFTGCIDYSVTPLIVTSSVSSGKITDVINHGATGAANLYDCRVGLMDLKTRTERGGADTFNDFIKGRTNPNLGGYYYAYAYDGTTYVDASCRIPLSQCSVRNVKGKRRAYVSMGVACNGSKFRYFDVGIANDGNGWYPSVYGKNVYLQNTGGGYTLDPSIQYYHTVEKSRTAQSVNTQNLQLSDQASGGLTIHGRRQTGGVRGVDSLSVIVGHNVPEHEVVSRILCKPPKSGRIKI
jgi:hypothetical protein